MHEEFEEIIRQQTAPSSKKAPASRDQRINIESYLNPLLEGVADKRIRE